MENIVPVTTEQVQGPATQTDSHVSIAAANAEKCIPRDAGGVSAWKYPKREMDVRQYIDLQDTLPQEKSDQSQVSSQETRKSFHCKSLIAPLLRSSSKRTSREYEVAYNTGFDTCIASQISPRVTIVGRKIWGNMRYSQIVIDSLYDTECQASSQPATSRDPIDVRQTLTYGRKDIHNFYNHALNLSVYQVNRLQDMKATTTKALQSHSSFADKRGSHVKLQNWFKRRSLATVDEQDGQLVSRRSSIRASQDIVEDSSEKTAVPVLDLQIAAQSSMRLDGPWTMGEDSRQSPSRASDRIDIQRLPTPKSESQRPSEYIPSANSKFYAARRAFRRSTSPKKRAAKQEMIVNKLEATPNMTTQKRSIDKERSLPSHISSPAPLEPPIEDHPALRAMQATQGLAQVTNSVSPIGTHSKEPSIGSIISGYIEDQSDASPVIFDARSVSCMTYHHGDICKTPSRPGPPPQGQLPSLPEGSDAPPPRTPRPSESSERRLASSRQSPTKPAARSPAKYSFMPADCSPPKRSKPPVMSNATTELEPVVSKPAAIGRVRTITKPEAFPAPPLSPTSKSKQGLGTTTLIRQPTNASTATSSTLISEKEVRTETTKELKKRDLARMRSQKAEICRLAEETPPVPPVSKAEIRYEGISVLPIVGPRDPNVPPARNTSWHRPHASLASALSASTTLALRESRPPPQRSPILVVAEQEPVSPLQAEVPLVPASAGDNTELQQVQAEKQDDMSDMDSGLSSITTLPPKESHEARESVSTIGSVRKHRSVANRAPTPYSPTNMLRAASNKSSIRSSIIEDASEVSKATAREVVREEVAPMIREVAREEAREQFQYLLENIGIKPKRLLQGENGFTGMVDFQNDMKTVVKGSGPGYEPKAQGRKSIEVNG